jgi:hypothetical protein
MIVIHKDSDDEEPSEVEVFSKPLDEIVCWPVKVTELYLGKRQITKLKDLDQFPNLNILWLNNNKAIIMNRTLKLYNIDLAQRFQRARKEF